MKKHKINKNENILKRYTSKKIPSLKLSFFNLMIFF